MYPHHVALIGEEASLTVQCAMCEELTTFAVSSAAYLRYQAGAHVQHAFPEMPPAERELLISGTCGACFAKLFGAPPEDEEAPAS